MNEDRVEGTARKAVGAVQETAGNLVGDDQTEAKGILNQAVGTVQDGYGKVRDKVKELIEDAPATARDVVDTGRDYVRRGSLVVTETAGDSQRLTIIAAPTAAVAGAAISWLVFGRKSRKDV